MILHDVLVVVVFEDNRVISVQVPINDRISCARKNSLFLFKISRILFLLELVKQFTVERTWTCLLIIFKNEPENVFSLNKWSNENYSIYKNEQKERRKCERHQIDENELKR